MATGLRQSISEKWYVILECAIYVPNSDFFLFFFFFVTSKLNSIVNMVKHSSRFISRNFYFVIMDVIN